MALSRFAAPVSDTVEEEYRLSRVPAKTQKATAWGIRVWNEWASIRGASSSETVGRLPVTTPLLEMTSEDLGYWLGKFVLEVRKVDGTEYPPKTLYALVCCFKRHYEANGVHSINPLDVSDPRFGGFRQSLDAEMQRLHTKGLGTKKKQAEPITEDEEAILWSSGQLGCHSARALQNTVYFYNCKVFGLRSYDEHHGLQCKQFQKDVDEFCNVYLMYTDQGSKTNRGGLKHMKVQNKVVKQYENPDDPQHCIVNIFDYYLALLPSRERHFYFRALPNDAAGTPKFANSPVGRNKLAKIIPDMCKAAGIEGYKTGHSGKVTCATTLYRKGFTDQLIKERTGHRSLEALHQYKRTGSIQEQKVSLALAPPMVNPSKETKWLKFDSDDDDDFVPQKKPKLQPMLTGDNCVPSCKTMSKLQTNTMDDVQGLFPQSSLQNCTFNISFK